MTSFARSDSLLGDVTGADLAPRLRHFLSNLSPRFFSVRKESPLPYIKHSGFGRFMTEDPRFEYL